jgi:hypothetical protein
MTKKFELKKLSFIQPKGINSKNIIKLVASQTPYSFISWTKASIKQQFITVINKHNVEALDQEIPPIFSSNNKGQKLNKPTIVE